MNLAQQLESARSAAKLLATQDRDAALRLIAGNLERDADHILEANSQDVEAEAARCTPEALLDRLRLTAERLQGIADAVRELAVLPDPLQRQLRGWRQANGLQVSQVTVPFGVIGMIYESRPNVTVDAAALVLKAGRAVVLRGSASALSSNRVLVRSMRAALAEAGLDPEAIQFIDSPDRALVTELLTARGKVDLVVPRGGASLIDHVVSNARVPVIETGVGNCHIYVDSGADLNRAQEIVLNAKLQRPGVCNAVETLLVHESEAADLLPELGGRLREAGVELRADGPARALIQGALEATEDDWDREYLDLILAVRVVASLDQAIEHIQRHGTGHSEAILTRNLESARRFQLEVDAAAVYVNASTRFTDGFALGFGAELGISTQKLHARGPMGLEALVTSKYLIEGQGQTRA